MDLEIRIEVIGNRATMKLFDNGQGRILETQCWEDKRDLSQQLYRRIEALLQKKKLSLRAIYRFVFNCDSPYFSKGRRGEIKMEEMVSTGKCGFTAWQTGEIITEVLNFALLK